jgi:hypothetical protein
MPYTGRLPPPRSVVTGIPLPVLRAGHTLHWGDSESLGAWRLIRWGGCGAPPRTGRGLVGAARPLQATPWPAARAAPPSFPRASRGRRARPQGIQPCALDTETRLCGAGSLLLLLS